VRGIRGAEEEEEEGGKGRRLWNLEAKREEEEGEMRGLLQAMMSWNPWRGRERREGGRREKEGKKKWRGEAFMKQRDERDEKTRRRDRDV
jgi:hypothetical protein